MPIRPEEQEAIVSLLIGQYDQILPIEAQWGIRFKEGDMRPRIDYFHDAVQAFTSGERRDTKGSRVSVEHIAYDIAQLHAIQEKPLGLLNRGTEKSPSGALVKTGEGLMASSAGKTPPTGVRMDLKQYYRSYTVFFTALLSEAADRNYFARCEEMDETIADIGLIETIVQQLASGRISVKEAQDELGNVTHDDLRTRMQAALARKKMSAPEKAQVSEMLTKIEQGLKTQRAGLDKSHLQLATTKMAIFHDSKDVVKELMHSGLNVAGKYLANAMQTQGAGRGQGR